MLTILYTYNHYTDLPFLPEKRVINTVNKLVYTFSVKGNGYVKLDYENFKTWLNSKKSRHSHKLETKDY